MGFKTGLLIGAAAGYVLGAKAGRERYDEIMEGWARITGDPRFQELADKSKSMVDLASERVKRTGDEPDADE
jgi:hypothetical protein